MGVGVQLLPEGGPIISPISKRNFSTSNMEISLVLKYLNLVKRNSIIRNSWY